jgi:hypothetical protein
LDTGGQTTHVCVKTSVTIVLVKSGYSSKRIGKRLVSVPLFFNSSVYVNISDHVIVDLSTVFLVSINALIGIIDVLVVHPDKPHIIGCKDETLTVLEIFVVAYGLVCAVIVAVAIPV